MSVHRTCYGLKTSHGLNKNVGKFIDLVLTRRPISFLKGRGGIMYSPGQFGFRKGRCAAQDLLPRTMPTCGEKVIRHIPRLANTLDEAADHGELGQDFLKNETNPLKF